MKLGEKLMKLRKSQGLSQEDLASRISVSRQAVSRWENGESVPDADNVVQLSRLFSVSTDFLLIDDYESDGDIPAVKATVNVIRDEQKRQSLLAIILGCLSLGAVFILVAQYLKMSVLMATGAVMQLIAIVVFEVQYPKYQHMKAAKTWKKRTYCKAIWLLAVLPAFAITYTLLSLYPSPFSIIIGFLIEGFIYLAICLSTCFFLRVRKK